MRCFSGFQLWVRDDVVCMLDTQRHTHMQTHISWESRELEDMLDEISTGLVHLKNTNVEQYLCAGNPQVFIYKTFCFVI